MRERKHRPTRKDMSFEMLISGEAGPTVRAEHHLAYCHGAWVKECKEEGRECEREGWSGTAGEERAEGRSKTGWW
jgi:hypothetical protein